MKTFLIAILLITTASGWACRTGALVTERAYRDAITAEVNKNKEWSKYKIDRIGSTMNQYDVTLRNGKEEIQLKFKGSPTTDCQAQVELLSSQKTK
jgi:hypothetical protein